MLLNNACQSNNWGAPIYQDVTVDNGSIHNRSWTSVVSGMINTINFGRKISLLDFGSPVNGQSFHGEGITRLDAPNSAAAQALQTFGIPYA